MSTRRKSTAAALVVALGLLSASCGGGDDPTVQGGQHQPEHEGEGGTVQIAGQQANNHGSEDVAGMSELEMELDDFYFAPTILEGEAGQTLTLNLFNEGDAPHTFTIEEQEIDETLQPGDEGVTVEVTFPDSGEVVFVCTFHEAQGMLGGLMVA